MSLVLVWLFLFAHSLKVVRAGGVAVHDVVAFVSCTRLCPTGPPPDPAPPPHPPHPPHPKPAPYLMRIVRLSTVGQLLNFIGRKTLKLLSLVFPFVVTSSTLLACHFGPMTND